METAVARFLAGKLRSDSPLSIHQQKNVDALLRISDTFHAEAGIRPCRKIPISEKLLVIESGHQPNFLPYPGVWKKVFLLHRIKEHLTGTGCNIVAVFGFADQNLSTAKLLYENKVPALNKQGYKKFGFRIPETEKWKRFNTLQKPEKDVWERELSDFRNHYLQYLPKKEADSQSVLNTIDTLTGILERCYARSATMADLNAFIFARICQELFDLSVFFFRYSDVQQDSLFVDEWKKILGSLPEYNRIYNFTIREKKLNLPPVTHDLSPFWYHCDCGLKIALPAGTAPVYNGTCPACKTSYSFILDSNEENLVNHMKNMGLSAVARNIIFSEGLGTRLFISGSGGGLRYGQVANEISRRLSMNIPVTLSWQSRDYYLGVIQQAAMKDTLRLFNLTYKDLISGEFNEKITGFQASLLNRIKNIQQDSQKREDLDRYSGLYRSTGSQLTIIKNTFSTIPSIIDVLVNFDASSILRQWNNAITCADIADSGEIVVMKQDICYWRDSAAAFTLPDIPRIYHSLELINEP